MRHPNQIPPWDRHRFPREVVPFDRYWMEREGLGLRHVVDIGDRALYRYPTEACVWATLRGDEVVALEVVEGEEAARLIAEHAWRLLPETKEKLVEALAKHPFLDDAISTTFGAVLPTDRTRRFNAQLARELRVSEGLYALWVLHQGGSTIFRRAALEAIVDDEGRTVSWKLVEGPDGRRLVEEAKALPGYVEPTRA